MGHPETISVAFADDHPVLLSGLSSIFASRPGYSVAGFATTAEEAYELVATRNPDVLVMDMSMPGDIFATISKIVSSNKSTRIIVFTAFSSVASALDALKMGATGFVLKGSSCDELFEAVHAVMDGQIFITRQYASEVMNGLRNQTRRQALQDAIRLSVREKQIVGQLLQARTNKEIAQALSLSEKTVKHYMSALMEKLNARNRVEVVIAAQMYAQDETGRDRPAN